MPDKEEIGKIAAFLETHREEIVEKWTEKKSVAYILRKYGIPTEFFMQRFAQGIVTYFVEILRYEKPVGHCPSMNRFVDLMYEKDVKIHEIFILCMGLRQALLHILDRFGESAARRKIFLEMLSEIFNKNLAGVLEYFEKRLLEERVVKEAAERLGLHIHRLQTILDLQENAIFKFDRDSVYLANRSFYRLVGVADREAFGTKYPEIWDFVDSADRHGDLLAEGRYEEWIDRLVDESGGECDISIFDHARSRNVTMHMKIKEMPGSQRGEYVVVLQDVTEQKEALESLNHMVYTDALTQVPNRRRFDEVLAEALDACGKRGKPFYLLIVDIHNLVEINERFGRDAGDEILESFAKKMDEKLKGRAFFGRIDGDRFGIVAENLSLKGAREYAKEVLSILHTLHVGEKDFAKGNVAIVSCQKEDDAFTMLKRAATLISGIKEEGGNAFADDTDLLEEQRRTGELVTDFLDRCLTYEKEGKTVEVVNFYQEVPIQSQGKIVKVTDDTLYVTLRKIALHALHPDSEIFLKMRGFPNVSGRVVFMDKERAIVGISGMAPAKNLLLESRYIHVRLEPTIEAILIQGKMRIPVEIGSLSLDTLSVRTPYLYDLKKGEEIVLETRLRWDEKDEKVSLKGMVKEIERRGASLHLLTVSFDASEIADDIVTPFIAHRQLEIIKELKESVL